MIYIIIGASCSGKSTFVRNSFIAGNEVLEEKDLIPITKTGRYAILGKYTNSSTDINRVRRVGTDAISRSQIKSIVTQCDRLNSDGFDVVLEGDKITARSIFDGIISIGAQVKLYLITCSVEETINRNLSNGSNFSFSHIKAMRTKAINLFRLYSDRMNGEAIDTTNFTMDDFSHFSMQGGYTKHVDINLFCECHER